MDFVELSDLEEGEILEYDSYSPVDSSEDFEIRKHPFGSLKKDGLNCHFELTNSKRGRHGCWKKNLKDKFESNGKVKKSNMKIFDLESVSSEGEYKSDGGGKCAAEPKDYTCVNGEKRVQGKHSTHFYGTVEDIMSEIGETICRKSRCNYKKRKSKGFVKYSDNSYNLWRDKIFSSHLREKKRKRKMTESESDSDCAKGRMEKRKKRKKKRQAHYGEANETVAKPQMRDFDEVRRNLLEKLKKQKAEEELKASAEMPPPELESSEIQEVDMLIDCTNYVDDPPCTVQGDSVDGRRGAQDEGEDELDLIKLRLIALASNKKRKTEEFQSKTETSESISPADKKADENTRAEPDLDRNELLLRAEALKTALLKKHQKRLNKLKIEKPKTTDGGASANELNPSSPRPPMQEEQTCSDGGRVDEKNVKEEYEIEAPSGVTSTPLDWDIQTNKKRTALVTNANAKKTNIRVKSKRKKRKSCSLASSLKENSDKGEALEEDDRTLRSQLLSDLMRKKSMKDSQEKPVLMDSIQKSANQIHPPAMNRPPPKENFQGLPVVKKNSLKKVNSARVSTQVLVPKIPVAEIQRIIVHLGSEDSSDEGGVPESRAKAKESKFYDSQQDGQILTEHEEKESAVAESTLVEKRSEHETVNIANYERSVELLLSQARRKIEGKIQTAQSNILATPEVAYRCVANLSMRLKFCQRLTVGPGKSDNLFKAVYKHLPPSQRLEYMRLKQKIAERERLKKQRNESSTKSAALHIQASGSTGKESADSDQLSQKPELKGLTRTHSKLENSFSMNDSATENNNSFVKSRVGKDLHLNSSSAAEGGSSVIVHGVVSKAPTSPFAINKIKNNLAGVHGKSLKKCLAPPSIGFRASQIIQSSTLLLPSSQALISKLRLLLKKIKIEKMVEENYEKEISKLKNQLNLFERRKTEQRFKIKKLGEESMKTYRAIQGIATRSSKVAASKERNSEKEEKANEGDGDGGSKAEEGKKVPYEPETDISKAESKIDKELNSDGKTSEEVSGVTSIVVGLLEYSSPLEAFKQVSDCSTRVDPNVIMCQYDLVGVCKDEECTYQHLRTS